MNTINWAHAGQNTVTAILFLIALYLYFKAVDWSVQRELERSEEMQRTRDLRILYEASLAFIARREAARFAPVQDDDARAFALDEVPLDLSA